MAARVVPERPEYVNEHERLVCERLLRGLPDGSVVLTNLRVTSEADDLEADLVALVPGSGVAVIEVKGGRLWHDEAGWHQPTPDGPRRVDPFVQAMKAKRALIAFVGQDQRWTGGRVRWTHHVVLPGTELAADFALPNAPRWQVTGRDEQDALVDQVLDNLDLHCPDAAAPDIDQVRVLEEVLQGRFAPARHVLAQAEANTEQVVRLTDQQALLLDVTRLLPRVEVRGGAGSGKTWLAMEHARRLADGRMTGRRERVAVLCYSFGLAHFLTRALCTGSKGKQPRFVGSFEDLANRWGISTEGARRDDSQFFEDELSRLMAEKAAALPPEQRFDAIIVDEAQDFADHWWTPVLGALADPEYGRLGLYSDEHQRVFNRFGTPPVQLVPLVLDHNLRNTRQIYEGFAPLAPSGMKPRGGSGPEVQFIPCSSADALGIADDAAVDLLDQGWEPGDVALLTVGRRHPMQVEQQEALGFRGYWDTYWKGDDLFYGHVLGFKGMERRVVVLCLNTNATHPDRGAERLYVGLSRATDLLVVVGDPDVVERLGGPEVLARLTGSGGTGPRPGVRPR